MAIQEFSESIFFFIKCGYFFCLKLEHESWLSPNNRHVQFFSKCDKNVLSIYPHSLCDLSIPDTGVELFRHIISGRSTVLIAIIKLPNGYSIFSMFYQNTDDDQHERMSYNNWVPKMPEIFTAYYAIVILEWFW